MGTVYYYMRISTAEERGMQKFTRQENALKRYAEENGLDFDAHNIYKEDKSGKNFEDRKEWQALEKHLHEGDTIVFKDICRFARETKTGLKKYMWLMNEKKVSLVFLDNPTLNTSYIQALSAVKDKEDNVLSLTMDFIVKLILTVELDRAEKERLALSKRIKEGIAASEKRPGRKPGRLDKMTDDLRTDIKEYLTDRSIRQVDLIKKHHVSRNTLKKYIRLVAEEETKQ